MRKISGGNLLSVSLGASLVATLGGCGNPEEGLAAEPLGTQNASLTADTALTGPTLRAAKEYAFTKVVALGEATPSGEQFKSYFVPNAINDQGDVFFHADTTSTARLFRIQVGKPAEQFAGDGVPAPGGGFFTDGYTTIQTDMNQSGDAVFKYLLEKDVNLLPYGRGQGVFRADASGTLSTLMRPGVTIAPNGKPFVGSHMYSGIDKNRDVVFSGIIATTKGINIPAEKDTGLGLGVFLADARGGITSIVSPGDPAPGHGVFDFAENGFSNDKGDIGFGAHVKGETCTTFGAPQSERIFCGESVYLYRKATGRIISIAHQGEAAPGGGNYTLAFGAQLNNQGDAVFIGDFSTAPDLLQKSGVFLWSKGSTVAIARPGDTMPGGGHMLRASSYTQGYHLNDRGEVFFYATLDTDKDGDSKDDQGIFVWKDGTTRLVMRSGTKMPGIGTLSLISEGYGYGGAVSNNHGELLVYVTTTAGNGYLVKAAPL